jgi:hypothetical protein
VPTCHALHQRRHRLAHSLFKGLWSEWEGTLHGQHAQEIVPPLGLLVPGEADALEKAGYLLYPSDQKTVEVGAGEVS